MRHTLLIATLASLCWFVLSGCSHRELDGTVMYRYEAVLPKPGMTVAVVRAADQTATLQWPVHKRDIEAELASFGFLVVPAESHPELFCAVKYSIESESGVDARAEPDAKDGGVKGHTTATRARYAHVLMLQFLQGANIGTPDARSIADIRVSRRGTEADLARVMPALAVMAFSVWPVEPDRPSGATHDVAVCVNGWDQPVAHHH